MLCGKIIFTNRSEAVNAVRGAHADSRGHKKGRLKITYWCVDCEGWHTSSSRTNGATKKKKVAEDKARNEKLFHLVTQIKEDDILHINTPRKFKIK